MWILIALKFSGFNYCLLKMPIIVFFFLLFPLLLGAEVGI